MDEIKITLAESEMPHQWYNIQADLPRPLPPVMSPRTLKPATLDELSVLFPDALLKQEMSTERWIDIPAELCDLIRQNRPTPLYRARRLEKLLDTPAHIYYKYEGVNASGSHKLNSALAQAWYNKQAGVKRLSTETGAGQWGSALAMACALLGMQCTVYMVKVSYQQKPYRKSLMQLFGAEVFASPTNRTQAGRSVLDERPDSPGSLGIAISEAVEDAATHDDTKYALGSVLNHVLMHQTIIGLEAKKQMEKAGEYPDVVIGCVGGGTNFGGIAAPFLMEKLQGARPHLRAVAVEPSACPTLTKGVYAYDYGDSTGIGPVAKMYTLGHGFMPDGIHAGGLRYHGMSPIISLLCNEKIIEAVAYRQNPVFEAAVQFARAESIVPAPESSHAIRAAIDEALAAKAAGQKKVILFNLSGHGHFDMAAYDNYLSGNLVDVEYPSAKVREALTHLPKV